MASTAPSTKTAKRAIKTAATKPASPVRRRKVEVRESTIHGRGVYAASDLRQGEKIIEYKGPIISWDEANNLPPSDPNDPNHTFLFSLADGKGVINGNQSRSPARWINHSCAPNCETEETASGRIFVEALRDIAKGEELFYDYCLIVDEKITKKLRKQYRCLCGADTCRGTMLALKDKDKSKKKKKKKK